MGFAARDWHATVDSTDGDPERFPMTGVAVVMVLSAILTLAISVWLFPAGSPIVDERVYIQEGRALSQGALVLPPAFDPDHRPFFTAPNDRGELVFKYTQVWPAVLGASWSVTGSERPAVVVADGAGVVALAAFAHALLRRRRCTVLAAVCFALSPLWLVLSASYLSYALSLALGLGAAAALLTSWRTTSSAVVRHPAGMALLGGLFGGLAVFARPFDAVLLLVPLAAIVIVRSLRAGRRPAMAAKVMVWHLAGAVVPLATLLAINRRITGHALRLGYSLVGSLDRLGFGVRLDNDIDSPIHYGASEAGHAFWRGLGLLVRWWPASIAGIVLCGLGLWAVRSAWIRTVLVLGIVSTPLAYLFVWGAWNAYVRFRSADLMGPYYYLPVTAYASVAIAAGITQLGGSVRGRSGSSNGPTRVPSAVTVVVVALALLLSFVSLRSPIRHLRQHTRSVADEQAALDRLVDPAPTLVLLAGRYLGYDQAAYNDVGLDGHTVYGLDDPARRIAVMSRFPRRRVIRFEDRYVLSGRPGVAQFRDGLGFARQRVAIWASLHRGPILRFTARSSGADAGPSTWYVRGPAGTRTWPASASEAHVEVDAYAVSVDGRPGTEAEMAGDDADGLCIGRVGVGRRDEVCFISEVDGAVLTVVAPGTPRTAVVSAGQPITVMSDVSDRLSVDLVDP